MTPAHGHAEPPDVHAAARAIMARVAQRDPLAFQELYDLYSGIVYSVAYDLLQNEAEASDIVQDVFLKIWNASELYNPVLGKVVSWIVTITRHRSLNLIRSGQRRARAYQASAGEQSLTSGAVPGSAEVLLRTETAQAVQNALSALPPEQREAISISFLLGLTHEETAARLGEPLGTVKARIRRGLARMKEQLQFIR